MFTKPRRYSSDMLIYEAFYVSLRNALVVALVPLAVFALLIAIEDYPRPEKFISTTATMMEIAFAISFFVNFLYYVYFIRLRRFYACLVTVILSCVIVFAIFFSELKNTLTDTHQTIIVASWFVLLGVIIIVNKIGHFPDRESRYDHESWLYRHELADGKEEEIDTSDPEDKYMHRYIEDPIPEEEENP
jgi:hypothetical protein